MSKSESAVRSYPKNKLGLVRNEPDLDQLFAQDELLKAAREELKYSAIDQPGKLDEILFSIGVTPFTDSSIEAYKDRATKANNCIPWMIGMILGTLALGAIGAFISMIAWNYERSAGPVVGACFLAASACCAIAVVALYQRRKHLLPPGIAFDDLIGAVASWKTCTLEDYERPVPEFVLQTALDFKRELVKRADQPEMKGCTHNILIDELRMEKVRPVDPFLVLMLKHPGQSPVLRYVEVWNEPKYKQERLA